MTQNTTDRLFMQVSDAVGELRLADNCGVIVDTSQPDPQPGFSIAEFQRLGTGHHAILARLLIDAVTSRPPDFIIGDQENPYMKRWWIQRDRNRGCVYLHQILRSDDDRALHDHPWHCTSIILQGELIEVLQDRQQILRPGSITSRAADVPHRLVIEGEPVWSLFITGPKIRSWGFHCPNGWVHWREFTNPDDNGATVGRGCGE